MTRSVSFRNIASVPKPGNAVPVALAAVFGPPGMLLIRREREPFAGMWGMPGGKVQYGEHLDSAIVRELREETGIRSEFREFRGVVTELLFRGRRPWMHYLLLVCRLQARTTRLRASAEGEAAWFAAKDMVKQQEMMIPSDLLMLRRLVFARPESLYYRCQVRQDDNGYRVERFETGGSLR